MHEPYHIHVHLILVNLFSMFIVSGSRDSWSELFKYTNADQDVYEVGEGACSVNAEHLFLWLMKLGLMSTVNGAHAVFIPS